MFHLRDGFAIERLQDGQIRLCVLNPIYRLGPLGLARETDRMALETQTVVPAEEFASMIASVMPGGETADNWRAALRLLSGEDSP